MSFTPGYNTVTSITKAIPAVVTTGSDHNLTTGQIIRLRIPKNYGMPEVNNKLFIISVLGTTTFSLQYRHVPFEDVDSRDYTAFTNVGTGTPAQMVAVGSGPTPVTGPEALVRNGVAYSNLEDATDNTSTVNIPF